MNRQGLRGYYRRPSDVPQARESQQRLWVLRNNKALMRCSKCQRLIGEHDGYYQPLSGSKLSIQCRPCVEGGMS